MKLEIPVLHQDFFKEISPNKEKINKFCNDRFNKFHNVCRLWCLYINPQSKKLKVYLGNRFTN